jgi:hypothetical protein
MAEEAEELKSHEEMSTPMNFLNLKFLAKCLLLTTKMSLLHQLHQP